MDRLTQGPTISFEDGLLSPKIELLSNRRLAVI